MSDIRALARRYYDAFNARDLEAFDELLADDVELAMDAWGLRGREAVLDSYERFWRLFPGVVGVPLRMLADDRTVFAELRRENRVDEDGPATAHVTGEAWEIVTVEAGRIVKVRGCSVPSPGDRTAVGMPSRREAFRLADEQAALREIATLVTRGSSGRAVFDAVSRAIARVLRAGATSLFRFEDDDTLTLIAGWSRHGVPLPIGERRALNDQLREIRATGRPRRFDSLPDDAPFVEEARELGMRSAIGAPIVVDGRVWGIVFASSEGEKPLPAGTEGRLAGFTELVATALANAQAQTAVQRLADEQAALRRVAELAARGAPSAEVLEAVAREACELLDAHHTALARFGPDGSSTLIATHRAPDLVRAGDRTPPGGPCLMQAARDRGGPVRVDSFEGRSPEEWERACALGVTAGAAALILVDGEPWGGITAMASEEAMPAGVEDRLAQFAEIAGTSIAGAQARAELQQLADEQAALRRVAELVARGVAPEEVLDAVVVEASNLLGGAGMSLLRFQPGGDAVVVATHRETTPVGLVVPSEGSPWTAEQLATRRTLRVSSFQGTPAEQLARRYDVDAVIVVPVMVEARVWGMLSVRMSDGHFPPGTEERLAQFAGLVGIAVANAESRAQLTASRARVVAAADESRRRVQRDVHDGAQQRLAQTVINLKLARQALEEHPWPAAHLIDESLLHADRASSDLRDLVRGILPASLTRGGLRTGVESLCADLPIDIDLEVTSLRLPAPTETTAYFVIAEALANVVKHANATSAGVKAIAGDDTLLVEVRDNGVGGADPGAGTGLTGLFDRVEASEGTLVVESPAGVGTTLRATLPVIR